MPIKERVTLLTGATGVVGRHIANRVAQRGGHVVLAVRNRIKGERLAEELTRRHPCKIDVLGVDLASVRSTQGLARVMEEKFGRLHGLVHAAAVTVPPKSRQLTADGFELAFHTNSLASFVLTNELSALLRQAKRARVVNISSSTGLPILMGVPGMPHGVPVYERGVRTHGSASPARRTDGAVGRSAPGGRVADARANVAGLEELLGAATIAATNLGLEQEPPYALWPLVAGDVELSSLRGMADPEAHYTPNHALVQSKLALRMLSWAAAARFKDFGDNVSVHVCHLGEVALSPLLARLGLEDGLLSPAQAATVPAFLACDKRLEGCGSGPFYWNAKLRIRQCAFMSQHDKCEEAWNFCEAATGITFPCEQPTAGTKQPCSTSSPNPGSSSSK